MKRKPLVCRSINASRAGNCPRCRGPIWVGMACVFTAPPPRTYCFSCVPAIKLEFAADQEARRQAFAAAKTAPEG